MTVSIVDVAESVETLETCAPVEARFAACIAQDADSNPFAGWSTAPATLRMYRLRNVVLDRALMVLLKDGAVIAETAYLQSPSALAALRVRPESLVAADIGHAVATCFDHWDANHYHLIAHTLPTLHAILQRHPGGDVGLVVPKLSALQRRSLALIGASAVPTITTERDAQYFLPVAEYYDFVAGRADYSLSPLSAEAYARVGAAVTAADAGHRLIYVDRGGSASRRMPNEAALVARLQQRGFHAVRLETLALDQQIALFKGAAMVVGQHGAGLANIAFCQPGAVVYELVARHYRNPCFLKLAMQAGLHYRADEFPTGVTNGDHTSAWIADIDVERVMRAVDELAALMPQDRAPP